MHDDFSLEVDVRVNHHTRPVRGNVLVDLHILLAFFSGVKLTAVGEEGGVLTLLLLPSLSDVLGSKI